MFFQNTMRRPDKARLNWQRHTKDCRAVYRIHHGRKFPTSEQVTATLVLMWLLNVRRKQNHEITSRPEIGRVTRMSVNRSRAPFVVCGPNTTFTSIAGMEDFRRGRAARFLQNSIHGRHVLAPGLSGKRERTAACPRNSPTFPYNRRRVLVRYLHRRAAPEPRLRRKTISRLRYWSARKIGRWQNPRSTNSARLTFLLSDYCVAVPALTHGVDAHSQLFRTWIQLRANCGLGPTAHKNPCPTPWTLSHEPTSAIGSIKPRRTLGQSDDVE